MTNDAERVSDIVAVDRAIEELCMLGENAFRDDPRRSFGAIAEAVYLLRNPPAADIIEAQSKALAEARAIIAKYWDGVDMLNDGPDDSDVAYAMGQIGEAHKLAGPIAETYRTSITPTPENPNG